MDINSYMLGKKNGGGGGSLDADVIAPEYSSEETYEAHELVIHDKLLYEATVNIETPEAWNVEHWQEKNIEELLKGKQDKLTAGTNITIEGNVISASGSGGGGLLPKLTVTTKALATITATLGTTVLTKTADADGIAVFELPAYGVWNLSVTDGTETQVGSVTVDTVKEYAITIRLGRIFGVEWGRTSSSVWTRTDDAELFTDPVSYVAGMEEGEWGSPFDDAMPWAGMVRTTDAEAGELVAIPKFYYKWTNTAEKMKLQISASPQPGFLTSPAHIDRGDGKGERDVVYVGRYHCAASNYKSTSGEKPKVNIKRATARTAIAAIGDDIWQLDHALWWTIDMLYLVEYANANCQDVIGYGRGNNSAVENMGYTDSMPYHTGTMLGSKTTYGCSTQYRNIEGLWDNCLDWCDGVYFSDANIYHILNPSQFSDNANGTFTGSRATATTKVIMGFTFPSVEGYEWAGYPAESDAGAATTTGTDYFCDNEYSGGAVLYVGGSYLQSQNGGLFYRDGRNNASHAFANIGSRLQKLP